MKVVAAPGLKVPMEEDPRRHIDDTTPVEINHTIYYVRRLADGDLIEAPAKTPKVEGRSGGKA